MRILIPLILLTAISCSYQRDQVEMLIPDLRIDAKDARLSEKNRLFYLDGVPFSGYISTHYQNGFLKSIASYYEGKLEGVSKKYYADGQLAQRRAYSKNKKVGLHEGWWENGNKRFYYEFTEDRHNGIRQEWYFSGEQALEFNYTLGVETGSQKLWNKDGSIRANYVVKNNRRYGLIGLKNCKSVSDEKGLYASIKY